MEKIEGAETSGSREEYHFHWNTWEAAETRVYTEPSHLCF